MKKLSAEFFNKLLRVARLGGPIKHYIHQDKSLFIFAGLENGVKLESRVYADSKIKQMDLKSLLAALAASAQTKGFYYPPYDRTMLSDPDYWVDTYLREVEKQLRADNPLKTGVKPDILIMPLDMNQTAFDYTVVYGPAKFQGTGRGPVENIIKLVNIDLRNLIGELGYMV